MATTLNPTATQQPTDMTHVTEVKKETPAVDFTSMNIYQKMMYVRQNIGPIHKKLDVVAEDNSDRYKGVAAADIIVPIENLLEQVGIFKVPGEIDFQINGRLTTQRQEYQFINIDNPEEKIVAVSSGQGFDMADKGINAASTNAIKYLYMRMFGLMAQNEDPETVHSMDKVYHANQMTAPPQMGGMQQPQQTAAPAMNQTYAAPNYQQQQMAAPVANQEPEPVMQESPEVARFKALVEGLANFNIPVASVYTYMNTNFFPNNPVDFNQPSYIAPDVLTDINERLTTILAPYYKQQAEATA